jgi:putative ABC transport system permease protein
MARPRFYTTAITFLGGFALILAVVGIYAVSAYSVAQRTHEIGVRLAIGGSDPAVRYVLLRQGLLPVFPGVIMGLAGVYAFGTRPRSPMHRPGGPSQ